MNENQRPKRSILSLILPYLLLAAIIAGFVILITNLNANRTTTLSVNQVDTVLNETTVKSVDVYDKEVVVEVKFSGTKNDTQTNVAYTVSIPVQDYYYEFKGVNGETHASYESIFLTKISGVEGGYIQYHYAFEVSWWDAWGPTVITLGATILIAIFLFTRLSSSVNGANNRAMDFNNSRARRIDLSCS